MVLCISLILVLSTGFVTGEVLRSPNFDYLTGDDGLSSSSVSSIIQDSYGFMWFGTQNGLNKYDGYSFKVFQNEPYNDNSLPHNLIQTMYLDGETLWIGTYGGLVEFDILTEDFTRYSADPHDPSSLSNNVVVAITTDATGSLWVGTLDGLNRLDSETGSFTHYSTIEGDESSLNHQVIRSLYCDDEGRLWIGTYNGLALYDSEQDGFRRFQQDPEDVTSIGSNYVMDIIASEDGGLWLGLWGSGISYFDPETYEAQNIEMSENRMYKILLDGDTLWGASFGGGLISYDIDTQEYQVITSTEDTALPLTNDTVYSLLEDTSGIIWIGTNGGAINRIIPGWESFQLWNQKRIDSDSYTPGKVNTLFEDSFGNIWVSIYNYGIDMFDSEEHIFKHFQNDPDDNTSLSNDIINFFYEDSDQQIWIGTNEGLNLFDKETETFSEPFIGLFYETDVLDAIATAMVEDKAGNIWFGTYSNGAIKFDIDTHRYTHYRVSDDQNSISDNLVRTILCDSIGRVWIGTNQGLNRYDETLDGFQTFYHDSTDLTSISSANIYVMFESTDGSIWIGTSGGGLNLYEDETESFTHYTREQGLQDNSIMGIEEDAFGSIWVSTRLGLSIIDPASDLVRNIDQSTGLPVMEMSLGSTVRKESNRLLFGTTSGVLEIDPDLQDLLPANSELVLTAFNIMGEPALATQQPYELQEIVIPPSQTFFDFEFADLQYLAQGLKSYSYKLEGFDKDWIYSGARNYGSYTNISPGSYQLRLRSLKADGSWSTPKDISIKILPPAWRSMTAYSIYSVILLLLLITIVYQIYQNSKRKSQKILHQEISNRRLEEEIKRRTAQIEQEKEQLSVTLKNITDAVISTDATGNVRFVNRNAEFLFDLNLETIKGEPLEAMLEKSGYALQSYINGVFESIEVIDNTRGSENLLLGDFLTLRAAHAGIKDEQGLIQGVVFVFRDVTEELEMQNRMQQHDKLESLGVLAGGIAHDFNNLLVGVFGYMELASMTSTEQEIKTLLSLALDPFERAKSLTQQLLTFSKGGKPIRSTLSIDQLVESSAKFALSGSNVDYQLAVDEHLWNCDVDKNQMNQVFDNLFINAKQAMPEGGTIDVTVCNSTISEHMGMDLTPGDFVQITIRDQGAGIDSELVHKIFDPFFTTKEMGSGLGLTTCYSIITKHDGNIFVSSKPQKGTTFTLYLPRSLSEIERKETEVVSSCSLELQGRFLVLDDEPSLISLTSKVLRRVGIEVISISDGKEIAGIVEEGIPLIGALLDLTIPGGVGGVGVIETLRAAYPEIPIFASSGYSTDPIISDPKKYGFTDSIQKPYTISELYGLIETYY